MKVRLRSKSPEGRIGLLAFFSEASKPLSLKEKLQVKAVDPFGLGRIKVKLVKEEPVVLVVSNSKWKGMQRFGVDVSLLYPTIQDKWLPSLTINKDYEVRLL